MSFTGNEDQQITLTEAIALTGSYRSGAPVGSTLAHYFGKSIISSILDQDGCVGIRIYYALTATNEKQLVIVGVTTSGEDLYDGVIADKSTTCPPTCAASSPL
jgi:hypothetical protein